MACFLIDWDGSMAYQRSTVFLPGAVDHVRMFLSRGHDVFITTARSNVDSIVAALAHVGLQDVIVIPRVQNPRVVINDMGAFAIDHPADSFWNYWEYGDLPVQEIR